MKCKWQGYLCPISIFLVFPIIATNEDPESLNFWFQRKKIEEFNHSTITVKPQKFRLFEILAYST